MSRYFPHEQLDVYGVALAFSRRAEELLGTWPQFWAVRDQLDRATESIVMNLAKAARLRVTNEGIYSLECSLGSVLECAACLDVACCRGLINRPELHEPKKALQQIARMEIGLRDSWKKCVREEPEPNDTIGGGYFLHESLDVYQRSLQVNESLVPVWLGDSVRDRYAKRIDDLATSLAINIAEGNGRFSKRDHSKFIGIAEDAGTKLAAYLDLIDPASRVEIGCTKSYLREVMAMLSGMRAYLGQ